MSARGGVQNVKMTNSAITSAHDMWMRIRIVMTSIAYIMMGHPGFLSWETFEELMEYFHELIFHRLDGQSPDIMFFNRAYLLTMNHWSNELRVTDCKLEGLITARTGWSHFWTNYQPSVRKASADEETGSAYDMSMLPDDVVERLHQVQALTKSLQGKVDKAEKTKKRNNKGEGKGANKGACKDGKTRRSYKKFKGAKNNQ